MTEQFKNSKKTISSFFLKNFRWQYINLIAFSAVINILLLAPSWYMLQVYDRVLTSYDENTLLGLSLIVGFFYIIYGALERYRALILVGTSEALDSKLSPLVHSAILQPNVLNEKPTRTGLADLNSVKQFLTGQPILSFLDAPWVFVYLATIAMLNLSLGIFSVASAMLLFFIALVSHRLTSGKLAEAEKLAAKERRLVSNITDAAESLQAMGMRGRFSNQLKAVRSEYLDNLFVASLRAANFSGISKFLRIFIQSMVLGYGAYLAIVGEISAGMIIAGSILLGRALAPIDGVINSWKQLADFKKSIKNLDGIMKAQPSLDYSIELGRPNGTLKLTNVSLRLRSSGKPTLDEVSIDVEAGESLALIGPSGAGKTSLLKVFSGIYKPSQGHAYIDGHDLAFRDLDSLGEHIGYLAQNIELLAGKASENIARFKSVDSEAVIKAAKMSGAHETLSSLPEGYETILGDSGCGLSEGQKRKLGLARAVYGDPAIVFLDEPGAGLDENSLKYIIQTILALKHKKTTVIFTTHQPAIAQCADNIAVIVDGKIHIYGSSKEVLQNFNKE